MYCGECGTKNNLDDLYCKECGSKLESNLKSKKVKEKKPISKSTKVLIGVIAIIIALIVGFMITFSILTSPKKIANDYIKAYVSQDANKLYNYLKLDGDKTFVSKKIFTDIMKDQKDSNIDNYTITGVEYSSSKLKATVNFKYTLKDSHTEKSGYIVLTKQKSKKFLFFDNWQIDENLSVTVVNNYTIKVLKDAKISFGGVKLTEKYLDKKESSSKYDVYVLPQVFAFKTVIKATLKNGFEIEDAVTPSSYYSIYTVNIDENSLSSKEKKKIVTLAKSSLNNIYSSAIANKPFSEIKSSFENKNVDITSLEKDYNDFLQKLSNSFSTLTSFSIDDISIYDIDMEDENMQVELKVNYDYEIKYKDFSDQEKTKKNSDYDYMTITLTYDNGNFYLVGLDDLETYFSRY